MAVSRDIAAAMDGEIGRVRESPQTVLIACQVDADVNACCSLAANNPRFHSRNAGSSGSGQERRAHSSAIKDSAAMCRFDWAKAYPAWNSGPWFSAARGDATFPYKPMWSRSTSSSTNAITGKLPAAGLHQVTCIANTEFRGNRASNSVRMFDLTDCISSKTTTWSGSASGLIARASR